MKIIKSIVAAALALAAVLPSSAKDRKEILKVYNWSNYIAEGVVEDFQKWYKEQTGEEIEVIYMTFDVNEAMLSKIEKGHEDYDVVCPSDYIIERMLNTGLLLPLDFAALEQTNTPNYMEMYTSPYIRETFSKINPDIDANNYSVAFMWGTTGILFNPAFVSKEEASTWNCLRNEKFFGKILMKDAPRDVYSPILMYLKQDDLRSGKVSIEELMYDASEESLAAVEAFLMECKPGICGFEADLGKEQMTKNRAWLSLNWSGDAIWAIEEAEAVGVTLDYVVPVEGSNTWFDGWVIPKYSKNVKAATYWIDFMSRPDIAIRNMDETGYIAACGAWEVLESVIDESFEPIDLSYFFGEDAKAVCVNPVQYPDRSVIERCSLMHDWGNDTERLLSMWQNVKGSQASAMTFIIIGLVLIAAGVYVITSNRSKKHRRKSRR